jgi:anti-sigma factor RsiW
MNCEQAEELLSAYLDDALEPGLSEQVRAHLETCEHCRAILEDYRRLDAELATAPMVAPDDSLRDRLFSSDEYKALLREQQEAADAPTEKTRRIIAALHPNSPLWSKALLPIAAAVALALLLTVLARQGFLPFGATNHPVATTVPFSGPGQNGAPLAAGPRAAVDARGCDGRRVGGLAANGRERRKTIRLCGHEDQRAASDPQRRSE